MSIIGGSSKVAPEPGPIIPTSLELKPKVSKSEFNSKLETIHQKTEMSRAEFQDLAKNVVGGEKSLAAFLKTNKIIPPQDVEQLSKLFHFGRNANLKVNINQSDAVRKITGLTSGMTERSQLPAVKLKDQAPFASKVSSVPSARNKEYMDQSKALVTELEGKITNLKAKMTANKEEINRPGISAERKAELKDELITGKFSLVSLESKLAAAKVGAKAGITKAGIDGYQASKAGDNLIQKVLGTKELTGGKASTLLNSDDLGILPSFKPKIKAEGADWGKVKSGFMAGKEGVSMREMILYRKAYIDQLAKEVGDKYGVELNLNSFGSTNLTSDYDATISVKANKDGSPVDPKTEAKVLQEFNAKFRSEWGVESGTVFDTNVYLKDFDLDNKKSPTYDGKLQAKYESGQNTLALVKQRIHMDQGSWDTYKNKLISNLPRESRPEAIRQYAKANEYALGREKELNTEIIKINNPAFDTSKATPKALEDEVKRIKTQPGVHAGDIEAQASNRLYERKLDVVQAKIEEGNGIGKKIAELEAKVKAGTATPRDSSKLAELKVQKQENEIDTKMLKGEALFFANEPYFSEGTVRHVVGNLQRFKDAPEKQYEIPKASALQSLNENTGDTLKDFNHYMDAGKPDGNLGKVMFKTSKYVERLCDSLEVTLGGKDKNIPADQTITLKGRVYPLKDVVADLKASLKEPLAIRGETREKGATDERKSSEAISLFKGTAKLDVFKNVSSAAEYKQLLLDITARANVIAR